MRDSHDRFLRDAFESMVDRIGSNDTVQFNEIQSLQTQNVSSFIVDFNELKVRQTQPSNFINCFHRIANMH